MNTVAVVVPSVAVPRLIGIGGGMLRDLQSRHGVRITVPGKDVTAVQPEVRHRRRSPRSGI